MNRPISILLDSFKGSIGAAELGAALAERLGRDIPGVPVVNFPCSDGGDGFAEAVGHHLAGQRVACQVNDPKMRPRTAHYLWSPVQRLAIIESAQANGLARLTPDERDPFRTTTYGVGELLLDARRRGVEHIIIGVGGSATVDGGIGMAQALGWRFTGVDGRELGPWMAEFDPPATVLAPRPHPLEGVEVEIACDVRTRLLGPREASAIWIYGPQKGGTPATLERIEAGLTGLSERLRATLGCDYGGMPSGGAAGGLAAGLAVFAGAALRPGMTLFDELTGLASQVAGSAMVITGEGKLDAQSAEGKVVDYISQIAVKAGVPVVALCGMAEASTVALDGVVALTDSGRSPDDCIARPLDALDAVMPRLVELVRGRLDGKTAP
jgi:glycerate 2-kinase